MTLSDLIFETLCPFPKPWNSESALSPRRHICTTDGAKFHAEQIYHGSDRHTCSPSSGNHSAILGQEKAGNRSSKQPWRKGIFSLCFTRHVTVALSLVPGAQTRAGDLFLLWNPGLTTLCPQITLNIKAWSGLPGLQSSHCHMLMYREGSLSRGRGNFICGTLCLFLCLVFITWNLYFSKIKESGSSWLNAPAHISGFRNFIAKESKETGK